MKYYEEFKQRFLQLEEIAGKYNLDLKDMDKIIESMENFRVTSPIIGNFSTGKSSLINAILGKDLVSVDITPETAVPMEIYYGHNKVYQHFNGAIIEHNIEDLPLKDLDIHNTDVVQIEYEDDFLKTIQCVKIVDLPGFDTSIELHNEAIDRYLPNSLAYLLVVASDEPVLKDNIVELLKQLKENDVPVYLILTKCDRLSREELIEYRKLINGYVSNILGMNQLKMTCTESYGTVRVEGVRKILLEIQQQTAQLFYQKYAQILKKASKYAQVYLMQRIDKKDMTTSDLELELANQKKKMDELMGTIDKEIANFEKQTNDCINVLHSKIREYMEDAKEAITVMILNGDDIRDRMSVIVRNAISVSLKAEFEPRLYEYTKVVAEIIETDMLEEYDEFSDLKISLGEEDLQKGMTLITPIVLATAAAIMNPVLAVAGLAIGAFADVLINRNSQQRKEMKAKKITTELIDKVSEKAAQACAEKIHSYVEKLNEEVRDRVLRQKMVLIKSINDIKDELELEEHMKEKDLGEMKEDLRIVQEYINLELL